MDNTAGAIKGRKILVVEDDTHLRTAINDVLVKLGAEVRTAENGLVAKTILDLNADAFEFILSDIKMPAMDGLALLKYCKAHTKAKVLIFTGFSEMLETTTASELGADAFLAKPFRLAELVKAIEQMINPTVETDQVIVPAAQLYCSVGVDDFFSTTKLVSDLYVKVGESKFVKIAKEGVEIEISRLQHFKDHKVDFLYVRTEDFHKYTGLNLKLVSVITQSPALSQEKKMRLFRHTSEMLVQQILTSDFDKALYDNACAMTENTIKTILENNDLFEVLASLQMRGDELYSHSVAVSVYACLVASKMGWGSVANQHKIALAGLFHDVGFKELPEGLHEKPRFKMTVEENKLYESHTTRGREILASIPSYPSDLTMIVGQHHERSDGQGYPGHLTAMKTHPIARLIHFADEFVERLATAQKIGTVHPKIILQGLFRDDPHGFDREVLNGAFSLLGLPRPGAPAA